MAVDIDAIVADCDATAAPMVLIWSANELTRVVMVAKDALIACNSEAHEHWAGASAFAEGVVVLLSVVTAFVGTVEDEMRDKASMIPEMVPLTASTLLEKSGYFSFIQPGSSIEATAGSACK